MKINVLLKDGGKLPIKKTSGAACYDCYASDNFALNPGCTRIVPLGFCIEVPDGYYAEIRGRSGLSSNGILVMTGTVDSDYRGEVGAIVTNLNNSSFVINKGDRICQMMIKEVIPTELNVTDCLSSTERGDGGFGSTGK